MNLSNEMAEKSVHASVAAIEIYNKPDFLFREEAFSMLMTNAWELLLKAKWLADHAEDEACLFEQKPDGAARVSRCGNPCTHGLGFLAERLVADKDSGFDRAAYDNVLALIEIRDTSAHFIHKDLHLGKRVLEVATASLRNFLVLTGEWFQIDLSRYNFFLMPLSFYHGFEAITATSISKQPDQVKRLIAYLDKLVQESPETGSKHVALTIETKFVRAKEASAIAFRWTDNPDAPAVKLSEEDVLRNYPMTYRELTELLRRRYVDFREAEKYHQLRRKIEQEKKYCITRALDPRNPKSSRQRFYNTNIVAEFDRHFTKRTRAEQS
jgi:hypothetical protein